MQILDIINSCNCKANKKTLPGLVQFKTSQSSWKYLKDTSARGDTWHPAGTHTIFYRNGNQLWWTWTWRWPAAVKTHALRSIIRLANKGISRPSGKYYPFLGLCRHEKALSAVKIVLVEQKMPLWRMLSFLLTCKCFKVESLAMQEVPLGG